MVPDDLVPAQRLLIEALEAQSGGDAGRARRLLEEARALEPADPGVNYSLAALLANDGDAEAALSLLDAVVERRPGFAQGRLARAQVLLRLGRADEARRELQVARSLDPGLPGLAGLPDRLGLPVAEAPAAVEAAAPPPPGPAAGRPIAAAAAHVPPVSTLGEAIAQAQALQDQGLSDAAIGAYGQYLSRAADGLQHVALHNAGVLLSQRGRGLEAEAYLRQSLALRPDFAAGAQALGQVIEANGRADEAARVWESALAGITGDGPADRALRLALLNQVGRVRELQRDYPAAEAALAQSLAIDPAQPPVLHHWIHLRQKQCAWPVIPGSPAQRASALASASALAMLGLSDDPLQQLASARRFVAERVGRFDRRVQRGHDYGHDRLRIGYLSSDLSMHAVSLLTVELFERHRRDRVEVHAFCWSREDGTPFRERVRRAFDRFHRIDRLDDEEAAQLIVAQEIDVLVDLHGLTSNARPNIVARGPAPLQVAYLGFPGPTALPYQDLVVADPFIFPEALREGFTEAPLRLPTLYQCSDSQRPIGPIPTRAQLGLPEDRFVFCAFNNNFKFTPEVFEVWMRVLRQVPQAVLWLLEDNPWSRAHLEAAARSHGVDAQRLYFAPRVAPADYLARFAAADLFLDTYPFTAGTTANDVLWAGLPLLTCAGRTYVSRMAGSLLTSAGLGELVTHDHAAYERLAVELAGDPARLAALRERLAEEKRSGRLFSTDRFVREFEDALADELPAIRARWEHP